MARITVLGAGGFIGSHLAAHLTEVGHDVCMPARDADLTGLDLGRVAYCIGLTADFRQRPFETVEAHVSKLALVLKTCAFESLVYLSSTRLYSGSTSGQEDSPVPVAPAIPTDLFNISKLMGESLCLNTGRTAMVARLSNVYGPDFASSNFLIDILRDAVDTGQVLLRSAPDSAKDYISLERTVDALTWMLTGSCAHRVYNVASGCNTTNAEIAEALERATGCRVSFEPGAPRLAFPPVDVSRLLAEHPLDDSGPVDALPTLVEQYRLWRGARP